MTSERLVAWFRMAAVSSISTMNVLRPAARSSDAPMRLNSLSTTPIRARAAGTKDPTWAISTMTATCRRKVDLPAMLGPVSSQSRFVPPIRQSLATKAWPSASRSASATGCRPSRTSSPVPPSTSGSVQWPSAAAWASPDTKSRAAAVCATLVNAWSCAKTADDSSAKTACSATLARPEASSSAAASVSSSGVLKRVDEARPWRSVNPTPSAFALDDGTSTW